MHGLPPARSRGSSWQAPPKSTADRKGDAAQTRIIRSFPEVASVYGKAKAPRLILFRGSEPRRKGRKLPSDLTRRVSFAGLYRHRGRPWRRGFGRRTGLLSSTLTYVEKVRPQFLSLRQLGRSRLFSAQLCWQLSPILAAIFDSSSGRLFGEGSSFFSKMAHFSLELWTPRFRYGSPNSSVSRGL